MKSYRFGPDEKAFADPEHEPENQCYCPSSVVSSGNSSSSSSTTTPKMMPTADQCAPHGTFNVSLCQYGNILFHNFLFFIWFIISKINSLTDSPVLLSFPHFYMGDQRLRNAVQGMDEPDADRHEFYIDVQPVSIFVTITTRQYSNIHIALSIIFLQFLPPIIIEMYWNFIILIVISLFITFAGNGSSHAC